MPSAIHPISGSHIDAQFRYAFAHWLPVSQVAGLNLTQSGFNTGLRHLVAEAAEPFCIGFTPILLLVTDEFDHGNKCSIKATENLREFRREA